MPPENLTKAMKSVSFTFPTLGSRIPYFIYPKTEKRGFARLETENWMQNSVCRAAESFLLGSKTFFDARQKLVSDRQFSLENSENLFFMSQKNSFLIACVFLKGGKMPVEKNTYKYSWGKMGNEL